MGGAAAVVAVMALATQVVPAAESDAAASRVRAEDGPRFVSLFDGKTLHGWTAADSSWWSVEDGAITAKSTQQKPCKKNQYLFCQVGVMKDFELKLVHRIVAAGSVNCGFQFRSEHYQGDNCKGYQVDNDVRYAGAVRGDRPGHGCDDAGQAVRLISAG